MRQALGVARKLLVVKSDGATSEYTEVPAPNEYHLQDLLRTHPELLPLDELALSGPLLVVGRETTLASGSIDLVGLAPSGDVVLVEFKTGPQNPDFRAALAQLVDYGSDLWGNTVEQFDVGVVQRYTSGPHCKEPAHKQAGDLQTLAELTWKPTDEEWAALQTRLAQALTDGDFVYVVAAQRFTPAMTNSLDYLNSVTRSGRYHLVQMIKLDGDGNSAYSVQVVSGPNRRRAASAGTSIVTQQAFLEALPDGEYREAVQEIITVAESLGLKLAWGSKGTSIRLETPDRAEPLSVGWMFPEGAQWSGLTHVSFGYDAAAATQTPSVQAALDAYIAAVLAIPGGTDAKSKSLKARIFQPSEVAVAVREIVGALDTLVSASQEPTSPAAGGSAAGLKQVQ